MPEGPAWTAASAAWAHEARALEWSRPFSGVVEGALGPSVRWFPGGRINVAVNCIDRHLGTRGDRVAVHFEGEPGDRRSLTYRELAAEVDRFAAALVELGVGVGDRVALYLGMVPEAVVAMLACARIGAVHTVLPSALPAEALADRLADFEPHVLVTQDGAWRHGVLLPLKVRADEALTAIGGVEHTVVVRRTGVDVPWYAGDRWWHELTARRSTGVEPVPVESDHPLLVVYLGNRRGRPLGFVHRSAGLLVQARALHRALATSPDDVYWCAVDIGWVGGQTHGVYGPLAAGATLVLYEGTLDTPSQDRAWTVIERYRVAALVTIPSVVRSLHQWVDAPPTPERVGTLRHIVTFGERIELPVLRWLQEEVGRGRAVVRDGWGQTELGGAVTVTPPPAPELPDPGMHVLDGGGASAAPGEIGELVLTQPWPGQFLSVRGDPDGGRAARHWVSLGHYATGDLARRTATGGLELLGRIDPVIQVLGQLVSASEVQDVLEEHPYVASAEVVGQPDARRGQVVAAAVVLAEGSPHRADLDDLARELRSHVEETLGGLARPQTVAFLAAVPPELPRPVLRRAIELLCRHRMDHCVVVSLDQLRAAIVASADG